MAWNSDPIPLSVLTTKLCELTLKLQERQIAAETERAKNLAQALGHGQQLKATTEETP